MKETRIFTGALYSSEASLDDDFHRAVLSAQGAATEVRYRPIAVRHTITDLSPTAVYHRYLITVTVLGEKEAD